MTLRISTVAGLAAAGLVLAACQTTTTPSGSTTRFATEERQACADLGFTPGTANYEECVEEIERQVDLFQTQLENEYGGHIDVVVECEVEVEAGGYRINCTRALA